jgi:MoaA/NifB/PqqE/SkfB family radical SAM enzyme
MPTVAKQKWQNPDITAKGERRAVVAPVKLDTLWFNTGTQCNIECSHCYIESSPKNDRLVYITRAEVASYLDEIKNEAMGTSEIAFTGGEPFLNPEMIGITEEALSRGYQVLILSNAMKPLQNKQADLLALRERYADKLHIRVSLDHYSAARHDEERGTGSWDAALDGLRWLAQQNFRLSIAGRALTEESPAAVLRGYQQTFDKLGLPLKADNTHDLIVFPEMDETAQLPEITTDCWELLGKKPESVMCASSRMVMKRKGDTQPSVAACTLLPYDSQFNMGTSLKEAWRGVKLNHPHCAKFCVLGGASCSNA